MAGHGIGGTMAEECRPATGIKRTSIVSAFYDGRTDRPNRTATIANLRASTHRYNSRLRRNREAEVPRSSKPAPVKTKVDLDSIKRLVIAAMFADDELMSHLVLKGGNALDLVHKVSTRASVDIDFSMSNDFPGGLDAFRTRVAKSLTDTFARESLVAFDVRIAERPSEVTPELRHFWGGYKIEFKLVDIAIHAELQHDIEKLRNAALRLGEGTKFLIDVSRYEYTEGKQVRHFDGYTIFVYSVPMMICEKLRAICQQMPAYGPVVRRERETTPRARDFVDIHALMVALPVAVDTDQFDALLRNIFSAKQVPIFLLADIKSFRDFHRQEFPKVLATVKPGTRMEPFDFYFDYVLSLVESLKARRDI